MTIMVCGISDEQAAMIVAALPDKNVLQRVETVSDILVAEGICSIINAAALDETDVRILENYYADAADYANEQIVWIGDAPPYTAFFCYDSFGEMFVELENILQKALQRYEIQSMYCCEYGMMPARFIADSLERDVLHLLHQKYGENLNPEILKRMRQEWSALMEIDAVPELAAVYELTLWLRKMGHPYWIGGCVPSGFVPYLLGITRVNPLPSELGGHNLVWQEYASYGRSPYYDIHLSTDLRPSILAWLRYHWLGNLNHYEWKTLQPFESRYILRGNMHFLFDLVDEQGVEEIPSLCREDIFFYLKKHGFVDKDAFRGMCSVRKGRGFPVITDEMRTADDNWILKQCKGVRWLPSKAHLLEQQYYITNKRY